MNNKFNTNEKVIVNGIGKCNGKEYKDEVAIVINRDPFFCLLYTSPSPRDTR